MNDNMSRLTEQQIKHIQEKASEYFAKELNYYGQEKLI